MKAKKHIYGVYISIPKFPNLGMQPVKGDNKKDARARFKKRFAKKHIRSIIKLSPDSQMYNFFKRQAI